MDGNRRTNEPAIASPSRGGRHAFHALLLTFAIAVCPLSPAMEPLITDDSGTIGAGRNQVEFGWTRDRMTSPVGATSQRLLVAVYTRGLSDTFDLYLDAGHVARHEATTGLTRRGLANPVIGAKWRFAEDADNGYSFLLKPELILPVNAAQEEKGLGMGRTSYALTAGLSRDTGFGALHVNLRTARERSLDAIAHPETRIARLSVAPVWNANARWMLAADWVIQHARSDGLAVRTRFAELAAIYAASEDLELAFGLIRQAADGNLRTTSATAGVTWRFD